MQFWRFVRSRAFVFLHDLLGVPTAIIAAWLLLNDFRMLPLTVLLDPMRLAVVAVPAHAAAFIWFGCYRGIWRYASLPDVLRLVQAILLGWAMTLVLQMLWPAVGGHAAALLILYPVLLMAGLSASRLSYRMLSDRVHLAATTKSGRALVVGAGRAGDLLVRDMIRTGAFKPIGFVDDEPAKHGHEVQGVRVIGRVAELPQLLGSLDVDVVLIAMPSAPRATMDSVVQMCLAASIECRTLPSMIELAGGAVEVSRLRPVTVEDLLGRDPVSLDDTAIAQFIRGKRVLVTGGGGSIGSELCRQVAQQGAAQLLVFERGEFNLYQIEQELRADHPRLGLECRLGDVRDAEYVGRVFERFRPQVVFHAAAYKHVPLVEDNPLEGVHNNVIGTRVVADAAVRAGVERFVLVSTDKTVNPTNVMGTTKRVAEIYCQGLASAGQTSFITTRFGNVLASAGSVVPLFERQIKAGGPVTVTHPDVTRYFMTIPEAVGLILQAGAMGRGGDIFVLDMGEPVKIRHLAEKMIQLSGLVPDRDIKIVYSGLRPGEKLFEELFYDREQLVGTRHPKLLLASCAVPSLAAMESGFQRLIAGLKAGDREAVLEGLRILVPEYQPSTPSVAASELEPVPAHAPALRVVK